MIFDDDKLFKEAMERYKKEIDYYFEMLHSHSYCPITEEYYVKRHIDAMLRRAKFIKKWRK